MSDVYHTFFGICGLSLMGFFTNNKVDGDDQRDYNKIDPTFALPVDVIQRLGISAQILPVSCNNLEDEKV